MIKSGMIGFSNNKTGFVPQLIKFFTKSKISHSFILTQDVYNIPSVHEAGMVVQIVPFDKYYKNDMNEGYYIYNIININQDKLTQALSECHHEFSGVTYGYLQLLWFIYRALMNIFGIDVRKQKNWLSNGVICSELVYYYLVKLGLGDLVKDFNPDTIQAQDILSIVQSHPELFELIEVKE